MFIAKVLRLAVVLLVFGGSSLSAKIYSTISYYIAYDSSDNTKYALVMPAVSKIYTHKAGDISNLANITTQFASFPVYSDGTVCFSALSSSSDGSNGSSTMANKCFETKFFYIQKDKITSTSSQYYNKTSFMLYYKPTDKLQEGIAGLSSTFSAGGVRVRTTASDPNSMIVYNDRSITQEDYTLFYFDLEKPEVRLGNDVCQGELNPITGECEVSVNNNSPIFGTNAISSTTLTVGQSASISISNYASDIDGDTIAYSVSGLPSGLTYSSTSKTITGTPTTAGTNTVTITANDGKGGTATHTMSLTVNASSGGTIETPPEVPDINTTTVSTPPPVPTFP